MDIRAAIEASILKQRELEKPTQGLRALLLAQDVSSDSAGCIIEAVTRLHFFRLARHISSSPSRLNNTLPLSLYNLLEFRLHEVC
ncbi:hypothetical protein Prudu_646S000100 [Prunus dulcis]|uniref:Uncharacterized protein n=1 Tax=Prunus dulcis TaxID=3755 RepID=A0A5H2XLA9_PRUDU|nr:hypothetical protein Prudu_646S000100 [Prunus dulcis]